jgi:hypothetical protein
MTLGPAADDLANRDPVWAALSEMFLDTELDTDDIRRVGAVLATSPYELSELEIILLDEVYPACRSNLFLVAGEWAGFDQDWLRERILRRQSWFERAWAVFGRAGVRTSSDWRGIRTEVATLREKRRPTSGCN